MVIKNLLPFLFKAFSEKKYAEDFMYMGKFRLGSIDYYKKIEDSCRQDQTEGESSYLMQSETGRCHVGEVFLNPTYLLCTSGPDVDLNHLRKKGQFIIKINDPKQLLDDINTATPINSDIKIIRKAILLEIAYTNNQVLTTDPDSIDAITLDYIQKSHSFAEDKEYRYIITASFFEESPKEFLYYEFGRRLNYIELLPTVHL